MTRQDAMRYVSFCIDDALAEREMKDMPDNARLVGFQCGFEPLFVAVWSYLGVRLSDFEAETLAIDLLSERKWFSDSDEPHDADYIL